ncbi:MAG: TetR/AcrR family transcriptional regulator [Paludibacteraceae bacterium]
MPRKVQFSREMIIDAAIEMVREKGYESINARDLGTWLGCSSRPLFTAFKNMEEVVEATRQEAAKRFLSFVREAEREDISAGETPVPGVVAGSKYQVSDWQQAGVSDSKTQVSDSKVRVSDSKYQVSGWQQAGVSDSKVQVSSSKVRVSDSKDQVSGRQQAGTPAHPVAEPISKRMGMRIVQFAAQEPNLYDFIHWSGGTMPDVAELSEMMSAYYVRDYKLPPGEARDFFEQMMLFSMGLCTMITHRVREYKPEEIGHLLEIHFQATMEYFKRSKEQGAKNKD